MKHFVIALVVAVITIAISMFVLSDSDADYESDAKREKTTALGEIFEGEVYDFLPIDFECREFSAVNSDEEARYGCILSASITNTSIFEQQLLLDGDYALDFGGQRYASSDELSKRYVSNNELVDTIGVNANVSGGIFFVVPRDVEIEKLEIFEGVDNQPIVVTL